MADLIDVTVVYAALEKQIVIAARVSPGASFVDAIRQSGILHGHPEIELEQARIGVWGKLKRASMPVSENDRIEMYRGLVAEPNATRLARAAKKAGRPLSHNASRATGNLDKQKTS